MTVLIVLAALGVLFILQLLHELVFHPEMQKAIVLLPVENDADDLECQLTACNRVKKRVLLDCGLSQTGLSRVKLACKDDPTITFAKFFHIGDSDE